MDMKENSQVRVPIIYGAPKMINLN